YINVPMQEYISHHAIGRSSLGVVADKSPAHLQALIKKNESKNSVSLSLGTALHTAILEPEKFKERYVKEPYKLDKRRKQDKEIFQLLSEQYGAENILSENDWNRVEGMREALLANQLFSDLIEADVLTEATMLWKDPSFNLLCKARPDIMVDTSSFGEEGVVVPDIKTTSDARKFFFGRAMLSFNYYLQAQHYKEGVESLNMPFRDFIFFAVES